MVTRFYNTCGGFYNIENRDTDGTCVYLDLWSGKFPKQYKILKTDTDWCGWVSWVHMGAGEWMDTEKRKNKTRRDTNGWVVSATVVHFFQYMITGKTQSKFVGVYLYVVYAHFCEIVIMKRSLLFSIIESVQFSFPHFLWKYLMSLFHVVLNSTFYRFYVIDTDTALIRLFYKCYDSYWIEKMDYYILCSIILLNLKISVFNDNLINFMSLLCYTPSI